MLVPNCPGAKLSGAKLSGAKLSYHPLPPSFGQNPKEQLLFFVKTPYQCAYRRENGFDNLPRAKQDLMSVQYWPRSAGQGFYTASQNGQGG